MGPIWGRQVPGGPHVGPMHFAIWEVMLYREAGIESVHHASPPQYETLRPFMVIYGVIYVLITTRINSKSKPCDVVFDRYKLVWSKKMTGKYQYGVGYIENFDFSRPDLTSDKKMENWDRVRFPGSDSKYQVNMILLNHVVENHYYAKLRHNIIVMSMECII